MAGRKSLREELGIIRRYSDLTPTYFKRLQEALESENKEEYKWAVEKLTPAMVKFIPQDMDVTTDGLPLILPTEIFNKNALDTPSSPEPDSTGQTPISGS